MIQASELRIGNWLLGANGKDFQVDGYGIMIIQDEQIARNDISGIPLTADIMPKLGFEPVGESPYFKRFKLPNGIYIQQALEVVKNDPFGTVSSQFYIGENHTHIPTVHWLQNYLYFNYNGFELTFSA